MISPVDNAANILIVSCESGGAQIISSIVKLKPDRNYFFCLEPPAVRVFQDKIKNLNLVPLDFINNNRKLIDLVLTGTSWVPDLERKAVSLSKQNRVKVASVLDHWTNYRQRFLPKELWKKIPGNWTDCLPDEVWVCDEYAYDAALKDEFPKRKLFITNNPYLNDVAVLFENAKMKNAEVRSEEDMRILYISEPVAEDLELTYGDPYYWGYTEFDMAKSVVEFVVKSRSVPNVRLRFRLHPNESADKYDNYIGGFPQIEKSSSKNLLDDLFWADAVVGVESMAMVIGLAAGKPVFSYLPETARKKCCLPHKAIRHISSFGEIVEFLKMDGTGVTG